MQPEVSTPTRPATTHCLCPADACRCSSKMHSYVRELQLEHDPVPAWFVIHTGGA